MGQSVESDINGLQKVIADTNITQLQQETEMEVLKEEPFMKKNHEKEVNGLQNQIANSGLTVELDAPKSQDTRSWRTSRSSVMSWFGKTKRN